MNSSRGLEPDPATTPSEIRQSGPAELEIVWRDGHRSVYPVAFLRRSCPCAACVDEWTGEQILRPDQVPDEVKPVTIEPTGNYAIQIRWSDGHSSGIYTFEFLRGLTPQ